MSHALLRLQKYPPVIGPSDEQEEVMLLECEHVDPSTFTNKTLNPEFVFKYGHAILWYSTFERIMGAQFDRNVVPKFRIKFVHLAKAISFLEFCNSSDRLAVKLGLPGLGRSETEAAWVQELFFKYDKFMEDIKKGMEELGYEDEDSFRSEAKFLLNKAVMKRYTSFGVERYWARKRSLFPMWNVDITRVDDRAGEPGYVAEYLAENSLVAGTVVEHHEDDNLVAGVDEDEDVMMVDETRDEMDIDEDMDAMTFTLADRTRR